ncbi:hypothetical protein [Isoptericola croceus]|uniref:hypothetical protein n=1 Tax=Isoptericola croceus TaxID=3031406 RepID=UPI0023F72DD7|nr:hypothetical protein [Isoptericola croceus]
MRTSETPIFDSLAREFESQRPLIHVASALGGDPFGDPLSRTSAADVSFSAPRGPLPRRSRPEGSPA